MTTAFDSTPEDAYTAAHAAVLRRAADNAAAYATPLDPHERLRSAIDAATPLIRAAEARALAELFERRADAVPLYKFGEVRRATFLQCADVARERAEEQEKSR